MNHVILIGIGANLPSVIGNPADTIRESLIMLENNGVAITAVSGFYQTRPVPQSSQPDFINIAASAVTDHSPTELLQVFQLLEKALGRKVGERWSARTLDIDLLAYNSQVLPSLEGWHSIVDDSDPKAFLLEATVPHPRLHKRAFVLVPMQDIVPDWVHPVSGDTLDMMLVCPNIAEERAAIRQFLG